MGWLRTQRCCKVTNKCAKNTFFKNRINHAIHLIEINFLQIADIQRFAKMLQKRAKKNPKKRTTYQKNVYLCIVLINK